MSQQVNICFNIEQPNERKAAIRCLKADNAYIALHTLRERLRATAKYNETENIAAEAERWLEELHDLLDTYGISIEEELD